MRRLLLTACLLACATRPGTRPSPVEPAVADVMSSLKESAGPRWTSEIQREATARDPTGCIYSRQDRRATVALRIRRDGTISDVALRESSGVPYIDAAALHAFQWTSVLGRRPPDELFKAGADFAEVPFSFTLQRIENAVYRCAR